MISFAPSRSTAPTADTVRKGVVPVHLAVQPVGQPSGQPAVRLGRRRIADGIAN